MPPPPCEESAPSESEAPAPCLATAPTWRDAGLSMPLPALQDEEGPRLPEGLPPVVDSHVHLFPDRVFEAVWRWFDQYGWPIRYKLHTPQVVSFLLSRGVSRVVALHYA
ncbi:MAG TPA: amidohydrolase, partial [Myxococcus sp.]|nr:amidohydrolase [Myxococcus sp.]